MTRRKEESRDSVWTVTKGTPLLNQIGQTDKREECVTERQQENTLESIPPQLLTGFDRLYSRFLDICVRRTLRTGWSVCFRQTANQPGVVTFPGSDVLALALRRSSGLSKCLV